MTMPAIVPKRCVDCVLFSTEKERESWELPTEYDVPVCGLDDDNQSIASQIDSWETNEPPEDCPRRLVGVGILLNNFYEAGKKVVK